ncbi:MAG: MMPL family transporter [Gemmatimonadaceae bacterium]
MVSRRFARIIVRRRRWVMVAWLVASAALMPFALRVRGELEVSLRIRGSEAARVERVLASRFSSPYARYALLVATGIPSPDSEPGREILREIVAALDTVPGVTRTLSYLDVRDTMFLSAGRQGTFLLAGLDAASIRPDAIVPQLRQSTAEIAARLRPAHSQLKLRWTGDVPINFDLRQTSGEEARRAELRVLPLSLLLLALAFGGIVAALLPVVAGALAIAITLGAAVLINSWWPLSILLQNTVSMIGLGVGIDYALLTISRFREGIASGLTIEEAAADAAQHAGSSVVMSGAAVIIGFAALLLVPLNEIQSTGVGGIIVVGMSVLVAITLLPAVLASLGNRIEIGRFGGRKRASTPLEQRWRWWGRWVVARPWLVLVVAGTPLVLLAWEARRMRSELPRGNWLPSRMESARALSDLADMERAGIVNTLRVLIDLPAGTTVIDSAGWTATKRITATIATDSRVGRVQSITTLVPVERPTEMVFSLLPPTLQRSLVTLDRRSTLLEVVPSQAADFNDATRLARDLRVLDVERISGIPGTTLSVSGMPATQVDYSDAIDANAPTVVMLVVLLTLVALMVGFRSVLIPLKAMALNLLSVAAAFGAVVLVFQDGYGAGLLGLSGPLPGVFPAIPILVFCIVFGLSMDYEVFLVSRVAEARELVGDTEAIVVGLAKTGGVITSAAAIMIVVFGAFALGDFLFIKMLGFALVVAVFLDATIVRIAIGPALLQLAGRWNWWPGKGRVRQDPDVVQRATGG